VARTDSLWEDINGGTAIKTIAPLGYDILINGLNKYLNFNTDVGSSGYGFRDNSGVMEFKNSAGAWAAFGSGDLTKTQADTYYYPLSTNPAGYLTSASTLDATKLSGALPVLDGSSLTGVLHSFTETDPVWTSWLGANPNKVEPTLPAVPAPRVPVSKTLSPAVVGLSVVPVRDQN